jgi:hypothetical protein
MTADSNPWVSGRGSPHPSAPSQMPGKGLSFPCQSRRLSTSPAASARRNRNCRAPSMPGLAPIPAPGRFSDVLRAISPRATANRSGELDARDVGSVELIQFLKLNPACVPAIDDNIDRREQACANPLVSDLLLHAEALGRLDRRQSPVVLAGKDIRGKQLQILLFLVF